MELSLVKADGSEALFEPSEADMLREVEVKFALNPTLLNDDVCGRSVLVQVLAMLAESFVMKYQVAIWRKNWYIQEMIAVVLLLQTEP